ncbi:hypothetical protein J42TS3_18580 [Paenibacillus vini]|uniref:Uncharacterized protein n=1 Tax=Paenibacillus vini TaxID=1476024 RepID=A0ABQ4MA59_9BACL|nr:hypothetical protein J42TS3_18580 [Paenibacillus vini]
MWLRLVPNLRLAYAPDNSRFRSPLRPKSPYMQRDAPSALCSVNGTENHIQTKALPMSRPVTD